MGQQCSHEPMKYLGEFSGARGNLPDDLWRSLQEHKLVLQSKNPEQYKTVLPKFDPRRATYKGWECEQCGLRRYIADSGFVAEILPQNGT